MRQLLSRLTLALALPCLAACIDWEGARTAAKQNQTSDETPQTATVLDGAGPGEADSQQSTTSMAVRWEGFQGEVSGYEYQISLVPSCDGTALFGPKSLDPRTSYVVENLALPQAKVFNCIRALRLDGTHSVWVASDGVIIDNVPPTVVEGFPEDGSIDVARDGPFSLTFSEPIEASTLSIVSATEDEEPLELSITGDTTGTHFTFTPSRTLERLAKITVTLSGAVKDLAGNVFEGSWTSSFTSADGTWTVLPDAQTSANGNHATSFAAAYDETGALVVAWQHVESVGGPPYTSRLYVNRYDPSSGWSPTVRLPDGNTGTASNPSLAFDAAGNGFLTFDGYLESANAAWRVPLASGGVVGSSQLLEAGAYDTQLAVSANGAAVSSYTPFSEANKTLLSRRYANGVWTATPERVDFPEADSTIFHYAQVLSIDAEGNGFAMWNRQAGATGALWVTRLDAATGWKPPAQISGAFSYVQGPELAFDEHGNALASWGVLGGTVQTRFYDAALGTWSVVTPISDTGVEYSRVAMNGAGVGLAAWPNQAGTELSTRRLAKGVPTAPTRTTKRDGFRPQVGLDARGLGFVIWTTTSSGGALLVARESPEGGLGEPLVLEASVGFQYLLLVMPSGAAFAVWTDRSSPCRLRAAAFD